MRRFSSCGKSLPTIDEMYVESGAIFNVKIEEYDK